MPSDIVEVTLVLAGKFAGLTCVLAKCQFTDGKFRLQGDRQAVSGLIKYLGKSYQAFPENSKEHLALVKQFKEDDSNGLSDNNGGVQTEGKPTESGVQPDGVGPSTDTPSVHRETDDGDNGGGAGNLSNGDRHEDSGVHREEETGGNNEEREQVIKVTTAVNETETKTVALPEELVEAILDIDPAKKKLHDIVMALDPENDKQWTEEGLPAMAAIEQAMKSTGIIRSEVEEAAPGYSRETAREESKKFSVEDL